VKHNDKGRHYNALQSTGPKGLVKVTVVRLYIYCLSSPYMVSLSLQSIHGIGQAIKVHSLSYFCLTRFLSEALPVTVESVSLSEWAG